MIGVRRDAGLIVAHLLEQAHVVDDSRRDTGTIDVDGRRRPLFERHRAIRTPANNRHPHGSLAEGAHASDGPKRRLRASIWQFFLPMKCVRIILQFGLYAADPRDRLGP